MESLKKRKNPILYIDEIHNLVGAGSVSGGSLDASNLLKPYLTSGEIRFIGATTYEEKAFIYIFIAQFYRIFHDPFLIVYSMKFLIMLLYSF